LGEEVEMNNGYIKLYRCLREKGYYKDSEAVHLWVHLLMLASHKEKEYMFNDKLHILNPGQFITGRKSLAKETGISESKCERLLNFFKTEQQIEQQKTNKFRIISILNWSEYQTSEQQNEQPVNNQRTTSEQPVDTIKKDKNEKKEKNVITKVKYLDAVFLTDEQYKELDSKYGTQTLLDCIDVLNNYKMSSGKKYKSDYHTIQGWVIGRVHDGGRVVGSSITTTKKTGGAKSDGAEYPIDCEVNG
jgi:hypothetical protein